MLKVKLIFDKMSLRELSDRRHFSYDVTQSRTD